MLRRWSFLPLRSPDGGGGGPSPEPAPTPAPAPEPTPTPTPEPTPPPAAPVRPDWLPETAWDATAGKPTVDVAELLTLKQQHDERAGQVPKDAAEYQVTLPEGFTLPDGVKFEVAADDPLLAEARAVAHEMGLTQAQFSKIMGLRAKMDVMAHETWNATLTAEKAKLGEKAVERIDTATAFLQAKLPAAQFAALKGAVTTADGVAAVETLMTLVGGPKLPTNGDPSAGKPSDAAKILFPGMN